MNESNRLSVKVSRDSVCAGDDVSSHEAEFFLDNSATIAELITKAISACPLASISGGKATWIICSTKNKLKYIGVVAQQWVEPKFIVNPEIKAIEYLGSQEICIDFKYWCQANPLEVFSAVSSGTELPNMYR